MKTPKPKSPKLLSSMATSFASVSPRQRIERLREALTKIKNIECVRVDGRCIGEAATEVRGNCGAYMAACALERDTWPHGKPR